MRKDYNIKFAKQSSYLIFTKGNPDLNRTRRVLLIVNDYNKKSEICSEKSFGLLF